MFLQNAAVGQTQGHDKKAIVEKARLQREQRAKEKQLSKYAQKIGAFCRGRLVAKRIRQDVQHDLELKLQDIERLKSVLMLQTMPLPSPVLHQLISRLLFSFKGEPDDITRLMHLGEHIAGVLSASNLIVDDTNHLWSWKRLVDLILQFGAKPSLVDLGRSLVTSSTHLLDYVTSEKLCQISVPSVRSTLCYFSFPRTTLAVVVRNVFLSDEASIQESETTQGHADSHFCLYLELLHQRPCLVRGLLEDILSLPLFHQRVSSKTIESFASLSNWEQIVSLPAFSPCGMLYPSSKGISSLTWLVGNLVWLSRRVKGKAQNLLLREVEFFTMMLRHLSPETFNSQGISVSWTKVGSSHSIPVVFPTELTRQLDLLVEEHYVRGLCATLLCFDPAGMERPLSTIKPVPMNPTAISIAEKYGFGDIGIHSDPIPLWKSIIKKNSSWAQRALEKLGFKSSDDVLAVSKLLAKGSRIEHPSTSGLSKRISLPSMKQAFSPACVLAIGSFCGVFFSQWHPDSFQSPSMRLLNTLSFCKISTPHEDVAFVQFMWSFLQEQKHFEEFSRNVDLVRVQVSDPYVCVLALFCLAYCHLLLVLDDEEMYEREFPLPLREVERVISCLKDALFSAYWDHGQLSDASERSKYSFGFFVIESAVRLLNALYQRCSRRPFCNVTTWTLKQLDTDVVVEEILIGTPRANQLITSIPFVIPFMSRLRVFQRLVQQDKQKYTMPGNAPFRIRIRRGYVLEDGLKNLNNFQLNLKSRINVVYVNEAGLDEVGIDIGGLFKEFWVDLASLSFDAQYGLFKETAHDQLLYPNPDATTLAYDHSDHLTLFKFLGRILGKALYEGIVVEPKFAHCFLSKLLGSNNQFNDLLSLDEEMYRSLMFLKSFEGDIAQLGLTHTVVLESVGVRREVELIPGGADVPVTNQNKTRYIHLVANFYLNVQIREPSTAFRHGLADLIDLRWLQMFNEPELQVLISGKSGQIDLEDLKAHTKYAGGYFALDKRVIWFWRALSSFSPSLQASFLRFATSCQRAPSLGFVALTPPFCIQKVVIRRDRDLLPSASTCFNTLKLPTYSSYKVLREKLLVAIGSNAGFEMS